MVINPCLLEKPPLLGEISREGGREFNLSDRADQLPLREMLFKQTRRCHAELGVSLEHIQHHAGIDHPTHSPFTQFVHPVFRSPGCPASHPSRVAKNGKTCPPTRAWIGRSGSDRGGKQTAFSAASVRIYFNPRRTRLRVIPDRSSPASSANASKTRSSCCVTRVEIVYGFVFAISIFAYDLSRVVVGVWRIARSSGGVLLMKAQVNEGQKGGLKLDGKASGCGIPPRSECGEKEVFEEAPPSPLQSVLSPRIRSSEK